MPSSFGSAFLGIAAFLHAARFLCASAICAGFSSANEELFNIAYRQVGPELTILSGVSFLIGVGILFQEYLSKFIRFWKDEFNTNEDSSKRR